MSNEQPSRPPRRSGSGASPMGSTLAIVIAIAAVVVGFLILKNIRSDDDDKTSSTTVPTVPVTDPLTSPTVPLPTEPQVTVFQPTTTGATVLVANSSHQNGVAKTLSTALQGNNPPFQMGEPTNGATKEAVTRIQYVDGDPAAEAVARSVAVLMGVETVEIMPTPVSLQDPTLLGTATVLVLLGDDKAGKTLAQMTAPADTTSTTLAGTTESTTAP
jgi:LytR cell envelope-related transcriptional attenuator